jgi:hypothetical protein
LISLLDSLDLSPNPHQSFHATFDRQFYGLANEKGGIAKMITKVRYQVFVSSTFEDLREERQQATQAILEAECFPSGMELFPASDSSQWDLIKKVIEESDYYIVILSGRYGSIGPHGLSYTEMEYDYAVSCNLPVLGFVRDDIGKIPLSLSEKSEDGREKLQTFRRKVMSRTCRKYSSPAELGMAVLKSLMSEMRTRPRVGWIRSDQARSEEDVRRERELADKLSAAERNIDMLSRALRDVSILGDEISRESMSQGDDEIIVTITYMNQDKTLVKEDISMTWDEIFSAIGPSIYGFICAKAPQRSGEKPRYSFEADLEEHIRARIVDKVQSRKITVSQNQIDTIVIQFKELGLIMFAETTGDGEEAFRGVTLTEAGERKLTQLRVRRRPKVSV